jgi:hypothetical protein
MPVLLRYAPYYAHLPSGVEYFGGPSPLSALSPHIFHISLAGRSYMVDFSQPFYRQYRRQLAQITRTQADTSTDPGEQTIDPNSMWRRSFEDWGLGAGQRWRDRKDSLPDRYWTSKGVDTLTTRWQVTLLPDTILARAATGTNLQARLASGYVYLIDGQNVWFSSDLTAWTQVAGTPAAPCSDLATDGRDIWMCYGASGIWATTAGSTAAATTFKSSAVDPASVLDYVNNRLMLASGPSIYNLVAGGPTGLPTPLWTSGNAGTQFVSFGEGNQAIYVAGGEGDNHYIWGITVTSEGTALGAPVVQGQVPIGETVTDLYGYLGYLIVGTDQGVRMCTTAANGAVSLGSLIPTPQPVRGLVGWGRFVYFGYTAYDGVSTGIGRLDLQNHVIENVLPAYASDLMAAGQANVTSVVMHAGDACFAVSGAGLYKPDHTHLVPAGNVTSGLITYGLTDPKTAAQIDCAGPIANGSYTVSLATDGGPFKPVGTHNAGGPEPVTFNCGPSTGQTFEVQVALNRDTTNPATGPTFTRYTLRSYPAPHRPLQWTVPILLNEVIVDQNDGSAPFDPRVELETLEAMAALGQMVTYQEGDFTYPVFVTDVAFLPTYPTRDRSFFNGVCMLTLQGLPPGGP